MSDMEKALKEFDVRSIQELEYTLRIMILRGLGYSS